LRQAWAFRICFSFPGLVLLKEEHWAEVGGAGTAIGYSYAEAIYVTDILHVTCA